jgi:FXSXX-COOH protein
VNAEESPVGPELRTELIDIAEISLDKLKSLRSPALARCLDRFRAEAGNPGNALTGFSNSL